MSSPVRIDGKTWDDQRIMMLSEELFGRDPRRIALAIGILAKLWSMCTNGETAFLRRLQIEPWVDPDLLVSCGLARNMPDGTFKIAGAEEKCLWLAKCREAGRKGGSKRKKNNKQTNLPFREHWSEPSGEHPEGDADPDPEVNRKENVGRPMHPGWSPSESHVALASEAGVELLREVAKFRDHQRSRGKTSQDWDAEFRNWLRRAAEFNGANGASKKAKDTSYVPGGSTGLPVVGAS